MAAAPDKSHTCGYVSIAINLLACLFFVVYPFFVSACPSGDGVSLPRYIFCTSTTWIPALYIAIAITFYILDMNKSLLIDPTRMSKGCISFWRWKLAALCLNSAAVAYTVLPFWWYLTSAMARYFFISYTDWGFQAFGIVVIVTWSLGSLVAAFGAFVGLCMLIGDVRDALRIVDDEDGAKSPATVELDIVETSRRGSLDEEESIGFESEQRQLGDARKESMDCCTAGRDVWWDAPGIYDNYQFEKADQVSGQQKLARMSEEPYDKYQLEKADQVSGQ